MCHVSSRSARECRQAQAYTYGLVQPKFPISRVLGPRTFAHRMASIRYSAQAAETAELRQRAEEFGPITSEADLENGPVEVCSMNGRRS
jgi:hypothetical protein